MDQDQKFQLRWEYRGENDEVDSSSDDSKSSLGDETVQKKHKLVSNLRLPQKEGETDALGTQQNSQVDATRSVHLQIAAVTKQHLELEKKKIAANNESKRNCGKKRKRNVNNTIQDQEPALLDDFRIFTESLLKDLKVARKKMFVQMKKQMMKLVATKPVTRQRRTSFLKNSDGAMHQTGNRSRKKSERCCDRLQKGNTKNNLEFDSGKCSKANGKRINHEKTSLESNRIKKRETRSLPGKKPVHLVKDSDQIGSSAYLTLPTVLPKPQTESLSTDSSLLDHIQPTNNAKNVERENSLFDENDHYRYLLGIQLDEQFGSFVQTSKSMGSSMVSVIPTSLHECPNNGFNITNRNALENPDQENSKVGLRMNGGAIGFHGRSPALSECFVTNTISSNINYDVDGGLVSFRSQEIRRDQL